MSAEFERQKPATEDLVAESRLDALLDRVEAPEPSLALRQRLYGIAARRARRFVPLWRRLSDWFGGGPVLRPVALGCTLLLGVVVGISVPNVFPPTPVERAAGTAPAAPRTTAVAIEDAARASLPVVDEPRWAAADGAGLRQLSLVTPVPSLQGARDTIEVGEVSGLPLY